MKAILDKTLKDGIGNTCRVTVFPFGFDTVEAYFHDYNGAVPRRYIEPAGQMQLRVDLWLEHQRENGFN